MPSLIPNYIARLRTHSQSTAASSSSHSGSRSNSTAGPPTPGPEHARLAADPRPAGQMEGNVDPTPQVQVARKIHPDLSALLDENAPPESIAEVLGPRPPRGRSRSAGQLVSMSPEVVSQPEPGQQDVQDTDAKSPAGDTPASPRSPFLSRILSAPLLGGARSTTTTPPSNADAEPDAESPSTHWSTFGRRRPLASAVGEFGSLHRRGSGSKSSAQSKASRRKNQQKSTPVTPSTTRPPSARTSTPSRAQTTETPPSQPNSPAGTLSSSSGSKSYSVRSRRPPVAHPEPILDVEPLAQADPQTPGYAAPASPFTPSPPVTSPRPTHPTLDDSPHTFGRATPKRPSARSTSRPYPGLGGAFLPPLSSTPPPPEHQPSYTAREPPSTYPQHTRTRPSMSGSTISFPSLPFTRSQTQSRPKAEDVFQAGEGEGRPSTLGARFGLGSFVSGEGGGVGRRTSADWSAAEAVRNGGGGEEETWPATVSREMVRLALAGGNGGGLAPVPVSAGRAEEEVGEAGTLREGSAKNPMLFGSTGEERRKFFRAGRRTGPSSTAPVSSSSAAQQSSPPPPLKPAFSVSPPTGPSALSSASGAGSGAGVRKGGLGPHLSVTAPTPSASPSGSHMGTMSAASPGATGGNLKNGLSAKSQGKRKMVDAEDEAPVDESGKRLILNVLGGNRDSSYRTSDASHAPSSFRQSKRIRLSTPSTSPPREHPSHPQSRPTSPHSRPPSSLRTLPAHPANPRSLSQSSIPLRAIVSPRPPSIDRRSTYHMRDPALPPPRRQSTQWTGGARKTEDEETRAFPLQGWAFIAGFLVFPVWWVAAVVPVGWGWRRRGVQDGKGTWAEEELAVREVWEYDVAYTWRRRCRLMSLFGLLVYIPLIVLLAVLVPRT